MGEALATLIAGHSFTVNHRKTHLMRRTQRQRVTGLVVNEGRNVPRDYVRGLRQLLYIWRTYSEDDAARALERAANPRNWPPDKPPPPFRWAVAGRVNYVGSIKGWTNPVYLELAHQLAKLDKNYAPKVLPPLPPGGIRVFCEGESDWPHLAAAQEYFHRRGDFVDLKLEGQRVPKWSDSELLKLCRALAHSPQQTCSVCLFDSDSPRVLNLAVDVGTGWKDWGNGVAAVAIASPPWRRDEERICIEMLHPPDVLERETTEHRRIFLLEEFSERNSQHRSGNFNSPRPIRHKDGTLVVDPVMPIGSETSVSLSKVEFGRRVQESEAPFADIDFEGFRPTFDRIEYAVRFAGLGLLKQ